MKSILSTAVALSSIVLASCGGSSSSSSAAPVQVTGQIQKGPFIIGSQILINDLTNSAEQTSRTIITETTDNLGSFSFSRSRNGAVEITAQGYYQSELTGQLSSDTLTLKAIYEFTPQSSSNAYVNMLTHLIHKRVRHLVNIDNYRFDDAINQAEGELITALQPVIPVNSIDHFTELNLFAEDNQHADGDAYLLTLSSIVYQYAADLASQNNTSADAELAFVLNNLTEDLRPDGLLDLSQIQARLITAKQALDPGLISSNLETISASTPGGSAITVANIDRFLDTDSDGTLNYLDDDDDNDLLNDDIDNMPYHQNIYLADINISGDEDQALAIDLELLGMAQGANFTLGNPSSGQLSGQVPNLVYTPTPNFFGTDEFTIVADNNGLTSNTATISITINNINDAPLITGTPDTNTWVGLHYSWTPGYVDADDDEVSFLIENKPDWANFSAVSGHLTGRPAAGDEGNYNDIRVSVNDGTTSTDLPLFSITVNTRPDITPEWESITIFEGTNDTNDHLGGLATAKIDNVIYIFGGLFESFFNQSTADQVFRFDLDTGLLEKLEINLPKKGLMAAHKFGDKIIIVNGSEWYEFDPSTLTFSEAFPRPDGLSGFLHQGAFIWDGYLYSETTQDGFWRINLANNNWEQLTAPNTGNDNNTFKRCQLNDKFYQYRNDGQSEQIQIYDASNATWSFITIPPAVDTTIMTGNCAALGDEIVFTFSTSPSTDGFGWIWRYNPTTQQWLQSSTSINIPGGRMDAENMLDHNGILHMFGGVHGKNQFQGRWLPYLTRYSPK